MNKMNFMKEIDQLKELSDSGLNQSQIGKEINLSQAQVCRLLAGTATDMKLSTARLINKLHSRHFKPEKAA